MLETATGLKVSFKTVDQAFTRLKSPIKKMLVARERSKTLRTVLLNDLAPYLQQPERLVFLDESGFNTVLDAWA